MGTLSTIATFQGTIFSNYEFQISQLKNENNMLKEQNSLLSQVNTTMAYEYDNAIRRNSELQREIRKLKIELKCKSK